MEILKKENMGKLGIMGIVFCAARTCLFGMTHFSLPAGTPGMQEVAETGEPALIEVDGKLYEQVIVPYTTYTLLFPINGKLRDFIDAWIWSGAENVGECKDDEVTDWWIRIFGGNIAVALSRIGHPDILPAPEMGFDQYGEPAHILKVMHEYTNFERKFWSTFRIIASLPAGRALLYRLLIEVRRVDDAGHGSCGDPLTDDFRLEKEIRNCSRSIVVCYDATAYDANGTNLQANNDDETASVASVDDPGIMAEGLFQELLRWFRLLENPDKRQADGSLEVQLS